MNLVMTFAENRRGNVAILFALTLLPVMFMVGSAIDYSRALTVDTKMQSALDATALALSKLAPTLNQAQLSEQARRTFTTIFGNSQSSVESVSATYADAGKKTLTVTAAASLPTAFMMIAGVDRIPIGASSTVSWGDTRLRVSLVLDNTSSMATGGKLDALKTASRSLLTRLRGFAANAGDVYVSIVPFNKDVNVGAANYAATWLRWDQWSNTTCILLVICTNNTNRSSWNGCVTDRDQNNDTTATAPTGGLATLFPAEQYGSCPVSLMPPSYDWSALNAKIDAMTASGTTNQTIGLQWGFQTLETNSPFPNQAADQGEQSNKTIILFTDGQNTQNRWSSLQADIDARTLKVCGNIKAAGYDLYVVQVSATSSSSSSLLQQCASGLDRFIQISSSSQISSAFNQIGDNLSRPHISR